jgi:CheY-like chemotaxis protein
MLAMLLGEDVRLETSVEPDLPCIHADRSQMEQVIMNLAANARDALPKGGRVTLSLSGCDLDAAYFREGESVAPGPYVKLSVKDDGTGMEEATLGRIFEPFFTTKRDGHGTGLGLSTVYGIVRQAGGTIRVASHRFHGTEFTIHLPVHSAAQEKGANAGAAGRRAAAGGETVLLVEDDQDLRAMTKDLLVLEGYKVLESRDVDEAMGFAQSVELPIDLLLTDIVMPGQNGRDLAESIRLLRPGLRIVFMSGYAPETLMPPGGWPDAGWLDKPFTAGRLLAKVRAALEAPVRP